MYPIRVSGALKTLLDQDRKVIGTLEDVVGDAARRRRHKKGIYTNPRIVKNGKKVRGSGKMGFAPVPGTHRALDL